VEQTRLERLLIEEVSGVDSPASNLSGWMVTKAAGGSAGRDRMMAALTALLNLIGDGSVETDPAQKDALVSKARHLLRDQGTGQFRRMNDHEDNIPDGSGPLPMQHSGAVLPALKRSLGLS
jgi:hypothetical protein